MDEVFEELTKKKLIIQLENIGKKIVKECRICRICCPIDELPLHLKLHNEDLKSSLKEAKIVLINCPTCVLSFTRESQFRAHNLKYHFVSIKKSNKFEFPSEEIKTNSLRPRRRQFKSSIEIKSTSSSQFDKLRSKRLALRIKNKQLERKLIKNTRPYTCQFCSKSFVLPSQCKSHENAHSESKLISKRKIEKMGRDVQETDMFTIKDLLDNIITSIVAKDSKLNASTKVKEIITEQTSKVIELNENLKANENISIKGKNYINKEISRKKANGFDLAFISSDKRSSNDSLCNDVSEKIIIEPSQKSSYSISIDKILDDVAKNVHDHKELDPQDTSIINQDESKSIIKLITSPAPTPESTNNEYSDSMKTNLSLLQNVVTSNTSSYQFKLIKDDVFRDCLSCSLKIPESELFEHIKSHLTKGQKECRLCEHRAMTSGDLRDHMNKHYNLKPYKCLICPSAYTWQSGLKKHMSTHRVDGLPHKCAHCTQRFPTQRERRRHEMVHLNILGPKAKKSKAIPAGSTNTNSSPTPLVSSKKQIEESNISPNLSQNSMPKNEAHYNYAESSNSNIYLSQSSSSNSQSVQNNNNSGSYHHYDPVNYINGDDYNFDQQVAQTQLVYNNSDNFHNKDTNQNHDNYGENNYSSYEGLWENYNGYTNGYDPNSYKNHIESSIDINNSNQNQTHQWWNNVSESVGNKEISEVISKVIESNIGKEIVGLKKSPSRRGSSPRPYVEPEDLRESEKCKTCGETVKIADLLSHVHGHITATQRNCTLCKCKCNTKLLLEDHYNIHYGLKPYICTICTRRFAMKSYLRSHTLQVHSSDSSRKYECRFCDKRFVRPCHQKCHERVHFGEKEKLTTKSNKSVPSSNSTIMPEEEEEDNSTPTTNSINELNNILPMPTTPQSHSQQSQHSSSPLSSGRNYNNNNGLTSSPNSLLSSSSSPQLVSLTPMPLLIHTPTKKIGEEWGSVATNNSTTDEYYNNASLTADSCNTTTGESTSYSNGYCQSFSGTYDASSVSSPSSQQNNYTQQYQQQWASPTQNMSTGYNYEQQWESSYYGNSPIVKSDVHWTQPLQLDPWYAPPNTMPEYSQLSAPEPSSSSYIPYYANNSSNGGIGSSSSGVVRDLWSELQCEELKLFSQTPTPDGIPIVHEMPLLLESQPFSYTDLLNSVSSGEIGTELDSTVYSSSQHPFEERGAFDGEIFSYEEAGNKEIIGVGPKISLDGTKDKTTGRGKSTKVKRKGRKSKWEAVAEEIENSEAKSIALLALENTTEKEDGISSLNYEENLSLSQGESEKNTSLSTSAETLRKCLTCSVSFPVPELLEHIWSHLSPGQRQCSVCKRTYCNALTLRDHVHVHYGLKPYKCDLCPSAFVTRHVLKVHVTQEHGGGGGGGEIQSKEYTTHTRLIDGGDVVEKEEEKEEEKTGEMRGETQDQIGETRKNRRRSKGQANGLIRKCIVKVEDIGMSMKKKCPFCSKMVLIRDFYHHKYGHREECHICGKMVKITDIVSHGATHVRSTKCELCDLNPGQRVLLWEHMNTHLKVRPLRCLYCGLNYTSRNTLRSHTLTMHTKIRPYSCRFCDRSFVLKPSLRFHERTHEGTDCKICSKSFPQKKDLRYHMSKEHKKRRIQKSSRSLSCL